MEEVVWKALKRAYLIFPIPDTPVADNQPNWDGCEYSKCGRTDRGVSAFGQVIGLRVRSNRPPSRISTPTAPGTTEDHEREMELSSSALDSETGRGSELKMENAFSLQDETLDFHPIHDEIPYCQVLNRLLPPDIRILAWCPAPPSDFSARFSCRERRYEYFFTQPAFTPTTGQAGLMMTSPSGYRDGSRREGWLDIEIMRRAARKFEGLHDFRNFCKIDASKQIENFQRRIFYSDILPLKPYEQPTSYISQLPFEEFDHDTPTSLQPTPDSASSAHPTSPAIYVFRLHGSAFLWHQVRHMISILFLIGQGLEPLSLIDDLLDINRNPHKPQYEMADDAPLVLRDCIFPREGSGSDGSSGEDALQWIYIGDVSDHGQGMNSTSDGATSKKGKYGLGGVVDDLWKVWRGRKMDEILAGSLLNLVVNQGQQPDQPPSHAEYKHKEQQQQHQHRGSQRVFQGGDAAKLAGKYVPVLQKPRMESVEIINANYSKKKEFEQSETAREQGFRNLVLDGNSAGEK